MPYRRQSGGGFMNMLSSRDLLRSSDGSHSAGASRITIFVLFTGVGKTLDALWSARRLARDLDAHIEIIVPEIVTYPLPLDEPREAVDRLLIPGSIVVIGTRHRWWPTREHRFGRWLRTKGCHVIFAGVRS